MIEFINTSNEPPYIELKKKYYQALETKQKNIEAIIISSYSKKLHEVNSRFVNLKFIDNNKFIFFSNYNSPKSIEFNDHNQITALLYWNNTNVQIRLKAYIKQTPKDFNNKYFLTRSNLKNALAISSDQSEVIESYDQVKTNYNTSLLSDNLTKCPDHWGGFSFTPYYFEFWEGHESRLNKREAYEKSDDGWKHIILQP
ncbi:pyridoxamine 5'-phosphate oxidase [Gammaproteobacteria bacterium]|jgi:pyridoxamine 5'-phosphate oxidase|nr:pyridoxamine 5'-phosphate oxidase [Gammaproteobacteria bacterium]